MDREDVRVAILKIMQDHVGVGNAITDTGIRALLYVPDSDKRKPTAGLREIIHDLRHDGYPICSGVEGYWYAETKEELLETIEALEGRARKIFEATRSMRRYLEKWEIAGKRNLFSE